MSYGYAFVKPPEAKWRCELFGCGETIVLHRPTAPNWFWRWMQYLILGNKWRRIK